MQAGSGSEEVEVVCVYSNVQQQPRQKVSSSTLKRGQAARMKANLTYHFH